MSPPANDVPQHGVQTGDVAKKFTSIGASFFCPGLGQFVMGRWIRGLLMLGLFIVGVIVSVIPIFMIVMPVIHLYQTALVDGSVDLDTSEYSLLAITAKLAPGTIIVLGSWLWSLVDVMVAEKRPGAEPGSGSTEQ